MKRFKYSKGYLPLPIFFPDATRAVVKTLDSDDVKNTKTPGVLVNTYHLLNYPGLKQIEKHGGIGKFMNWEGAIISDSGGYQIMSLAKANKNDVLVTDHGVTFKGRKGNITLTPEKVIGYQLDLGTDLIVVLDDFGTPGETKKKSEESMRRTIMWAERSRAEYDKQCKKRKLNKTNKPYLIGVSQGGDYKDLRKYCIKKLVEIGFDGVGYGGWTKNKERMHEIGEMLPKYTPADYLIYGLGVGKPEDIVHLTKKGYQIFDCVLPSRDARHKRLYVYNAKSISEINLKKKNFYSYYKPDRKEHKSDTNPVSDACDCLLCTNYSKAYLYHLFEINEVLALRLSTIHNLRFYSLLMEKLR
ncbi:tRNA-guanine transglycosylase [Patescibacteria group bacterium]